MSPSPDGPPKPGEPGVNQRSNALPDDVQTTSGSMVVSEARPDAGMTEQLREALPSEGLGVADVATPEPDDSGTAEEQDVQASTSAAESTPNAGLDAENSGQGEESDSGESTAPKGRITLIVGVVLLVIVVCFTVFLPNPNRYQWLVFGMLAALGGACIATVLSGFLEIESKQIKAGGALAVFTVVFFVFYSEIPERPGLSAPLNSGQRVVDGLLNIEVSSLDFDATTTEGAAGLSERETGGVEDTEGQEDTESQEDTEGQEDATGGPASSEFPGDTDALFATIKEGR